MDALCLKYGCNQKHFAKSFAWYLLTNVYLQFCVLSLIPRFTPNSTFYAQFRILSTIRHFVPNSVPAFRFRITIPRFIPTFTIVPDIYELIRQCPFVSMYSSNNMACSIWTWTLKLNRWNIAKNDLQTLDIQLDIDTVKQS